MKLDLFFLLDLWGSLQKERGLGVLFLTEQSAPITLEIKNQFILSDAAFQRFDEALTSNDRANFGRAFLQRDDLDSMRNEILSLFARPTTTTSWYDSNFLRPLKNGLTGQILRLHAEPSAGASAFLHLLSWLETLAQAREYGTTQISKGWLNDPEKQSRLREILLETMAYERLFFDLASERNKQTFASLKTASPPNCGFCDEITAALINQQKLAFLEATTRLDWFAVFSSKIEMLANIAKAIAQNLQRGENGQPLFVSDVLESEVENTMPSLRTLPLFKGISPLTLNSLLRTARIFHAEKGDIIITQGEVASKFFIVLDGWIKIYKSTPDGEESILQILGKKEPILDVNILHDGPCPISAKAVTRARALAIPLHVLREHLARHKDLVTNMMAATTHRLQKLTAHFEQVTLRSAPERVGWFLLHLYRETGLEGLPLTLPYDKSLIAAYLNLKPETFSRVLQSFKDKGFKIERQQIIMPSPRALCDFCDHDIAFRCCNADSDECPRIDLRRNKSGDLRRNKSVDLHHAPIAAIKTKQG